MEVCTQIGQGATTLEIPMPMAWSPRKVGGGERTIKEMETSKMNKNLTKKRMVTSQLCSQPLLLYQ